MEFNIAGPESAEMVRVFPPEYPQGMSSLQPHQVYERGCSSITNSGDLWTDYCSFKMETTHDPRLVRE